jgi:hypothetical protein
MAVAQAEAMRAELTHRLMESQKQTAHLESQLKAAEPKKPGDRKKLLADAKARAARNRERLELLAAEIAKAEREANEAPEKRLARLREERSRIETYTANDLTGELVRATPGAAALIEDVDRVWAKFDRHRIGQGDQTLWAEQCAVAALRKRVEAAVADDDPADALRKVGTELKRLEGRCPS